MSGIAKRLLSERDAPGHQSTRSTALIVAFLFCVAVVAYAPSAKTGFVWDAEFIYLHYEDVRDIGNLTSVFVTPVKLEESGNGQAGSSHSYYRPLAKAFYTVGFSLFGENPLGYKILSILLHGAVTILVYGFVVSITSKPMVSGIAALLFAINPIHTEAVVWTYSVSYLLVAVFSLGTLLLFRRGWVITSLVTFLAALLSHEMGVIVLPILAVQQWLINGAKGVRPLISLVPFLLLLIGFMVMRTWVVGAVPMTTASPVVFLNAVAMIVMRYIRIFLWPDAAVTIYPYEEFLEFSGELLIAYLVCFFLLYLLYFFWKSDRESLFWLVWFGAWTSVSLNIGALGEYLMAEKLLYISSIGLCVLAVQWCMRLFQRRQYLAVILLVPVLAIQVSQTWFRISHWKDTSTYLEASLEHAPDFYIALYTLAWKNIKSKNYDVAIGYLLHCVKSAPRFSPGLNNLGNLYYLQGQLHEAIRYWEQAVVADRTNPMPHFNIGLALERLGRPDEAKRKFDEYLRNEPNPPEAVAETLRSLGY
jgi:tetratricopeptide (TPR) repeat protein